MEFKSGRLGIKEKWYIDSDQIEVVRSFNYLALHNPKSNFKNKTSHVYGYFPDQNIRKIAQENFVKNL